MRINAHNPDLDVRGVTPHDTDACPAANVRRDRIAMSISGDGSGEPDGWLGMLPQRCELVGPRVVKTRTAHAVTIKKRKF